MGLDDGMLYVFDEVDTGIGGAIAEKVARAIRAVGRNHQVLCVTHHAAIASYADHHLAVSKEFVGDRTTSAMCQLEDSDRVREIARMLGGMDITRRTLEHAQEMVQRAQTAAVEVV